MPVITATRPGQYTRVGSRSSSARRCHSKYRLITGTRYACDQSPLDIDQAFCVRNQCRNNRTNAAPSRPTAASVPGVVMRRIKSVVSTDVATIAGRTAPVAFTGSACAAAVLPLLDGATGEAVLAGAVFKV